MSDPSASKSADGKTNAEPFPAGSIVKRPLVGWLKFIAYHTGIYVGGHRVIHLSEKPDPESGHAHVREDSLEDFAAGQSVVLHQAPSDEGHGVVVVARARAALNNKDRGPYSKWSNNCEDFTREMFDGKVHPKTQVRKIVDGAVIVFAVVVAVLAAAGTASSKRRAADS